MGGSRARAAAPWLFLSLALLLPQASVSVAPGEGFRGFQAVRGARVLEQQQRNHRLVPGSVLKLVVVAAALHHLGPEHRVATRVVAGGKLEDGELRGDLVIIAAGDPTWNTRFFPHGGPRVGPPEQLARQLAARGLRRVMGDLVVDIHRFPGRRQPPSRPLSESVYAFAAPTSALAVGENAIEVHIAPGSRVGEPAVVRGPISVENLTRTVSAARHGRGTVDFLPVWGRGNIRVVGEYPLSEPAYPVPLSVPDPDLHAGRALAAALSGVGIEVVGQVRVTSRPAPGELRELARFESPPLGRWLEPILSKSHNWYAEMLLRVLAAEVLGEGRIDEGLRLEGQFLEETIGLPKSAFQLDDASGLSPYNLLTPTAVVELLRFAARQPWRRPFMAALARPGKGTLKAWPGLPAIAAKTGTVKNALGLAGYLDPESSEPVIFAWLEGASPEERGPQRAAITAALRRWRGM